MTTDEIMALLKQLRRTDRHGYPSCGMCDEAADAIEALQADAARWRMLPAFFEEYQINALKLMRDIDAAIDSAMKECSHHGPQSGREGDPTEGRRRSSGLA